MKALTNYISEAIKICRDASNISVYTCQPKHIAELKEIIDERIKKEGSNCDLNDIDVSNITDMSYLFYKSEFNGDISKWDVSSVENMYSMFYKSAFNGNISSWNVSKVKDMQYMFAYSKFNKDISKWNVSNVKEMLCMFYESIFNQDISNWKIREDCDTNFMLDNCPIKEEFKPKSLQKK